MAYPHIESVTTVSPHDPILEDIASKQEIKWASFKDQQPRLIQVRAKMPDGTPLSATELGAKVREMRRSAYRQAAVFGMAHKIQWDPDRLILSVQFLYDPEQGSPELVSQNRIKGKLYDAELRFPQIVERARRKAGITEEEDQS